MIEVRLLTVRDGRKLVLGKYTSTVPGQSINGYPAGNLMLNLQFCKQIGHWVFCDIPPGHWQAGRVLGKLEFLIETGRDLNGCTEEFVKRNINF